MQGDWAVWRKKVGGSPCAHLETFRDFFKVELYSDDSFNKDS